MPSRLSRSAWIVGWTVASFVLSYASEWLAMKFTLPGTFVAIVWPASGVAATIGILVSPWTVVGLALADFAYQYPAMGFQLASISAMAIGLQIFVIAFCVRRYLGGREVFSTPGGVVRYAIFIATACTTISASIGVTALMQAGFMAPSDAWMAWLVWWGSDVISILLLPPLIIIWLQKALTPRASTHELAGLVSASALLVVGFIALPGATLATSLALLALPLTAWAAFRFGPRAVVTLTFALASAAFIQFVVPWRSSTPDIAALLHAQLFIALSSATGLTLAAYVLIKEAQIRQAATAEFAAVDAARNRLLSTFAHELNNPLTPILLELELLREGHVGQLAAPQTRAIGVVERNVLRLSKLVRDLRDVGLLQSNGALRLRHSRLNLTTVAQEVVNSYAAVAQAAHVTLDLRSEGQGLLEGDSDRLAQVLSNLMDNAIKYTPAGGTVSLVVTQRAGAILASVQDGGPGLTPEQIDRLFRPFEQVQTQGEQKNGTGLGLYIARGIVESHGGRLRCESDGPGRGARFVVELPHQAPPATPVGVRQTIPGGVAG